MTNLQEVKTELEKLLVQHGTLRPQDVVEAAKDEGSPLHTHFEWDDSEAAQQFRLFQAGGLIRKVKVTVTPNPSAGKTYEVRAFTSLPSDRAQGGGYRSTVTVLSHEDQRAESGRVKAWQARHGTERPGLDE